MSPSVMRTSSPLCSQHYCIGAVVCITEVSRNPTQNFLFVLWPCAGWYQLEGLVSKRGLVFWLKV